MLDHLNLDDFWVRHARELDLDESVGHQVVYRFDLDYGLWRLICKAWI